MQEGELAADCVQACERRLLAAELSFGHGADNALDEAVALVCHVLQVANGDRNWPRRTLDAEQCAAVEALLRQRIEARIPLAYLTGWARFAGLDFMVDPSVLIPRSPIAELILQGFDLWLQRPSARILDLCTGSGCIAIATAVHLPGTSVDAADLSSLALDVAAKNARLHAVDERVQLIQSNLFEHLEGRRYDLIVSNPPYVGRAEMTTLPAEYHCEPKLALASGEDGLSLPLKILQDAAAYLEDNGVLIMEVGNSDELLQSALPRVPFLWLEFERGGHGVLVLHREQLEQSRAEISKLITDRE